MTDHDRTPTRFTRRQTILAGAGSVTAAIVAGSTGRAAAEPPHGATDPTDGTAGEPGRFDRTTLWSRGEEGWVDFRVHAVDATPAGTILAFSEARFGTSADDGPKDLVLRRSVDGGATWGPTTYLERHDGGGWANPTPVIDRRTGRITVWYAWNDRGRTSKVFRRTSTDDGVSWSEAEELTHLFADNPVGWTFHLPGPGRGIQLADGRLLVEVWHRRSIEVPAAERDYTASVVASDDGGRTWSWGGIVPDRAGLGLNEARIAALATGEVILNSRLGGGPSNTSRAVSRSSDGGRTFSEVVIETNIAPHAGITSGFAARVDRTGLERVVYTSPVAGTERRTIYARISYDGAESWSWGRVVDEARAGYSDIVWLDDSTLLLLYSRLGASGAETLDVVAAWFDLGWLTEGRDQVGPGPVGLRGQHQVEGLRSESTVPRAPMIIDPAAAGSAVAHVPAAVPGDTHRVTVVPAGSGRRRLRCRFRAPEPCLGAELTIKVDGRRRGGPVATSTGDPYLEVDLGTIMVRAGRPVRIEFVVRGPAAGGAAFQVDAVSLLPPGTS
ncbi:sialidase family protein [Microlunatus speluncae]|uniref:sialidase family protein n=1 Tax=Microlunatus speluncae TaxID=2594267 RepID=UPI0012661E26|nr:sialidase family protein [Microlunatus speluncae]